MIYKILYPSGIRIYSQTNVDDARGISNFVYGFAQFLVFNILKKLIQDSTVQTYVCIF